MINIINTILYFDVGILLAFLTFYINKNSQLTRKLNTLEYDIFALKSENERLLGKNNELNKLNDHLKYILGSNKKMELKSQKDSGTGPLRYKNKENTIYYHGIGHLEKKYVWWNNNKNHCIIEYKNTSKNIKYPDWETFDINDFCNNCIPSKDLNKRRKKKFYYICQGHTI